MDVPRLRRVRGEQALYRARFTFRSAVWMQLDWMPVKGQHVVEPMDDALFARAPNADLRVVPRRTWPGPEPKVLDYSLSCVASGKPRVEERPWGRMSFTQRALWSSERRSEFALATFERLPLGHEYELFVSSDDGDHVGRRRFRFDGSEVAVDLYPGLRLRGRLDLGGVSVREPVRLEAFVQMGDGKGRDYLWQDRTRLDLASELTFDFAAIRRELGEGAADFPPPRSGRVRLEVVGFEPWEEHMAWPTDRSLLDLGTIVLEPRVPDLVLPRNALREGGQWVAILTPSLDDWNVVGSTSVDALDWLRLAHHHGKPFDAADHSHILALTGGPGFDDGVGFERDRDSWRELPSSDFVVRVELGPTLTPGDRLRLSWTWRDCVVLRGSFDGADFQGGREVELLFRAPAQGVELFALLESSNGEETRREVVRLSPGANSVRIF